MKFKFALVFFILFSTNIFANFLPIAKISKISGKAYIDKEIAKVGSEISEGMEVRVLKLSDYVDIKYQNGHVIRLTGGVMKVKDLNPKTSVIQLLKGTLYSLVKKLTKDEKFTVNTSKASFGVRGTRFYIEEKKKESYLCVCEGKVVADRGGETIDVIKDQDLFVKSNQKLKITPASKNMIKMGNDVFKELNY